MTKTTTRVITMLLAFVMLLSVVPMNHAHATENEPVAKSEVFAGDDIVTIIPDAAPEGAEGEEASSEESAGEEETNEQEEE